jgi:hypothetical protein
VNRSFFHRASSWLGLPGGSDVQPTSRRRTAGKRRRLAFELCEDRHLLSGASITGVKFNTVSSSGFTPVGTPHDLPLGGVFIDLFKDNGDGVFNKVSDPMVDRQQTAAGTGAYTFSNVADGTYFIQEEVPSGFTQSAGPPFYTVNVVGGAVYANTTTNIDDFSNPNPEADYFIKAVNPNPFTLSTAGSGIIGGQRDLTVNVLGAPNAISASGFVGVVGTSPGVFNLGEGPSGPGTEATLHYDADGAGLASNLTVGGNNGIRIDFDFLQSSLNTPMATEVTATGPGGTATFSTTTVTTNPSTFSVFFPFSSFSTTGTFSFANVTSLQFSFNTGGVQALDMEINHISDVQQMSTGFNFGNFPNPSCLAGFVYVDSNNNGTKDLGEPPISGVIVTLTGTNDLGQSVTQTTMTSSTGAYIFNNLRPGVYKLTETQPINFIDGKDTIGTPGGTTTNDMFSNINLPAGFCGMNNNFGELGLTPAFATKRSLLFPAQPVNLVAVYSSTTPPTNNGYGWSNSNQAVFAAVTTPTTTNTSSTSTAKHDVVATTSTASLKALLVPPKTTTTHH